MKKIKIVCEAVLDVDEMFDSSNMTDEKIIENTDRNVYALLYYFNEKGINPIKPIPEKMKLITIAIDEGLLHYDKPYIEELRAKAREDWKDVDVDWWMKEVRG